MDTIHYDYKHAIKGGADVWQWQQRGTFVWASAGTEREAIAQMLQDAVRRNAGASIKDVTVSPEEGAIVARNGTKWHGSEKSSIPHRDLRRRYVVESMDKTPVVLFPKLSDVSKNLPNRPSFMISIGQQRYEVRVLTEITPARLRVAEVISIDRGDAGHRIAALNGPLPERDNGAIFLWQNRDDTMAGAICGCWPSTFFKQAPLYAW
jgi:hypothetical protein